MCIESIFGGSEPKKQEVKFEPLPTKDSESVQKAKKDASIVAANKRGMLETIKNKGGARGLGDPESNARRSTLGGVAANG